MALCQKLNEQGQEGRDRRDDLIRAAEADVRAAHRAWRETAPKKSSPAHQADLKRFKEELWG